MALKCHLPAETALLPCVQTLSPRKRDEHGRVRDFRLVTLGFAYIPPTASSSTAVYSKKALGDEGPLNVFLA